MSNLGEIGGALRCYQCSSALDSRCADRFSNSSVQFLIDCSLKQIYDLTPIESCRKIKYKGKYRTHNSFKSHSKLLQVVLYLESFKNNQKPQLTNKESIQRSRNHHKPSKNTKNTRENACNLLTVPKQIKILNDLPDNHPSL